MRLCPRMFALFFGGYKKSSKHQTPTSTEHPMIKLQTTVIPFFEDGKEKLFGCRQSDDEDENEDDRFIGRQSSASVHLRSLGERGTSEENGTNRTNGTHATEWGCGMCLLLGTGWAGRLSLRPGRAPSREKDTPHPNPLPTPASCGEGEDQSGGGKDNCWSAACKPAVAGSLYWRSAKGIVPDPYYHVWRYTKRCVSVSVN